MSIPFTSRPMMARVAELAKIVQGEHPLETIVNAGYSIAKKSLEKPLWNSEVDAQVHQSLLNSAMKVARGSFCLTYTNQPVPAGLTRDKNHTYWVEKGCLPLSGLEAFLKGPTQTDCGGAAKAITLRAIADVLGEEKFNALISHPEMTLNFTKGASPIANPLNFFTIPAHTHFYSSDLFHITLGTRLYFQGIPWYGVKHPTGTGHGHWAFYLGSKLSGERLYWALGFDKLVTEAEIEEDLLNQYNMSQSAESREVQRIFSSKEEFLDLMRKTHRSKLKNCDAEMERCYEEPNIQISMEEAKAAGLGFFGYAQTERVSSTALRILKEMPLSEIQESSTPLNLGIYHISLLLRQSLSTPPEDISVSKTSAQAKNFLKWADWD